MISLTPALVDGWKIPLSTITLANPVAWAAPMRSIFSTPKWADALGNERLDPCQGRTGSRQSVASPMGMASSTEWLLLWGRSIMRALSASLRGPSSGGSFQKLGGPFGGCPCIKSTTMWVYIRALDFLNIP